MTTGEKIKQYRLEKKLSQKQFGEQCGIDEANIRKYETGKRNAKIETLTKMADVLGIEPYLLFGDIVEAQQKALDALFELTPLVDSQNLSGEKPLRDKDAIHEKFQNAHKYIDEFGSLIDQHNDYYIHQKSKMLSDKINEYTKQLNNNGKERLLHYLIELTEQTKYTEHVEPPRHTLKAIVEAKQSNDPQNNNNQ